VPTPALTAAPTPEPSEDGGSNQRGGENGKDGVNADDDVESEAAAKKKTGMLVGIVIGALLLVGIMLLTYKRRKALADGTGWKNITVDRGVGGRGGKRNSMAYGIELNEPSGDGNSGTGPNKRHSDVPLNLNPAYAI
jgi:hypothetical protein